MANRAILVSAILAVALLACDGDPAGPPTTPIRVEGTVLDLSTFSSSSSGPPVAGARVVIGLRTPSGEGAWAADTTDPDGRFAVQVDAPTSCVTEDSLPTQLRVEAIDFRALEWGSLDGGFQLACDKGVQTFDLRLDRLVYRTPRTVGGESSPLTPTWLGVGPGHACAVTTEDTRCWGDGSLGQVGNPGVPPIVGWPAPVVGGHAFSRVAAGYQSSCGLDADSLAWCWGSNWYGALGVDTATVASYQPVSVQGDRRFAAVQVGRWHACGLESGGDVYCWGQGRGLGADVPAGDIVVTPVRAELPGPAVQISAQHSHTCALLDSGELWCWGFSYAGELGSGEAQGLYLTPVQVAGGHSWALVDVGSTFTCALTTAGEPYCWGRSGYGQLGQGPDAGDASTPAPVAGGLTFAGISAGGSHACGVTAAGEAYCWGDNDTGGVGVPYEDSEACQYGAVCLTTPTTVPTSLRFTEVQAGGGYSCGVTTGGELVCWGSRDNLGSG